MKGNYIKLDEFSRVGLAALVLGQLLFNNGIYLFLCTGVFCVLFFMLQQAYKPGIFSFILMQHMLQVIAGVWLCNYLGKDINYRSSEYSTATILSVIGIVVLFVPIIYNQQRLPDVNLEDLKKNADRLSIQKVMTCYIVSFFVCAFLQSIAFLFEGLSQIIFSLIKIKWIFFILFGSMSILKNEKRNYLYLFIGVEFLSGLFSFFSDFKTVIYFVIIIILSLVESINIKQILLVGLIGVVLLSLALVWSSIKGEYRTFLNGGQHDQAVYVTQDEAFNKIYDLSNNVDENNLTSSLKDLLDRLQYTFHFAKAIEHVPAVIPYQNGANWLANLEFTTTPRYLNPDKPTVDNSAKATLYTGIRYLGASSGVSFSLGYFAECYVDFGKVGMMGLIFLFGIIYGSIYYYLMKNSSDNLLFNYAVVGAFFFEFYAFEQDGTFLLGRLFSSILTFILLLKFAFPPIMKYISAKPEKEEHLFAQVETEEATRS